MNFLHLFQRVFSEFAAKTITERLVRSPTFNKFVRRMEGLDPPETPAQAKFDEVRKTATVFSRIFTERSEREAQKAMREAAEKIKEIWKKY
eukprot:GEZU01007499.1.p1 GENE.GEZU01007499.1~~GEZU01007499.1.p1  ORF type:complete len:103 (-),score=25.11 GEZU01007499.1:119-391(-)